MYYELTDCLMGLIVLDTILPTFKSCLLTGYFMAEQSLDLK